MHEAPGGPFANGIITREYSPGQDVDVHIHITANHFGHFEFKLCANNDTRQDPDQSCFDGCVLRINTLGLLRAVEETDLLLLTSKPPIAGRQFECCPTSATAT